ncbi:MAG: ABC transporter substrate-binding protein [Gammaproteobacteria bacterium]
MRQGSRVIATLLIGAVFAGHAAHADTIKIGGLLETSGFLAALGNAGLEGAQLAVEQVNNGGGIDGKKIEFINLNTESDNTKAVTNARRLIGEEVVAIVGSMNSGSSYAIIDMVQRAGVPVVANGASRGIVLPASEKKWFFLAPLTDVLVQGVMMDHMKAHGVSKIALLNADSGFGTSGKDQLMKHAPDNGFQIVAQETFGNSDKDMTPQLTKIRETGAEATVIWATGGGQAISTKNYRQLGIEVPLYLSHAANSGKYIELAGAAANGVIFPSSKIYVAQTLPDDDPQKKVNLEFLAAYEARYDKSPMPFAGNGYDAMMIIVNAVKKVGTDRAAIRDAIERTSGYTGVTAVYSYGPDDHFGASENSVIMLTVKDGDFAIAD